MVIRILAASDRNCFPENCQMAMALAAPSIVSGVPALSRLWGEWLV